ncbi:MAG: hypothetical protein NC548_61180 [Lachnospiraceae bacterium]|nr:hypothetical protein [Lachnospiraceae bacterium]
MYVIKMNDDKSLETTVETTIYQNEKNADTLVFLLPRLYEEVNLADCVVLLRYLLPDGTGKSEELEMALIPYNQNYYRYNLKMNTRLTAEAGTIELWLCALSLYDDVVLKTGTATIEVTPVKEIMDYLAPEDLNQLDRLTLKVKHLEQKKADNIAVNEEGNTIQLTANGTLIGRSVELNLNPVWADMDDIIINPEIGSVSAVVGSLEDGAAVRLTNGDITEVLNICKSITLKGASAGFPQNYKQEVGVE